MELQILSAQEIRPLIRGERDLVNIVSACRIAKISRATLYRWIAANKVEWLRTPSGVRIYVDSIFRAPRGD